MKRTLVAPANPMLSRNLLLLFFIAFATLLSAQASLSVQGVLAKSDGSAVDDGEYTLTFRLWDAATGGVKVHQETITNVETTGGVYSVALGTNGTPMTAPFDKVYYLGVSIGSSSTELLPRPVLTHAPYALSLLGQSNQFPSTGAVTADAYHAPVGSAGNPSGYAFGSPSDPDAGLLSTGADFIGLYRNGSAALTCESSGVHIKNDFYAESGLAVSGAQLLAFGGLKVQNPAYLDGGIQATDGTINMYNPVEITSTHPNVIWHYISAGTNYSFMKYNNINEDDSESYNQNLAARLRVYGTTIGDEFYAVSDQRIKKDFSPVSTAESLAKLLRLQVTDYRYVDEASKGRQMKKGFIAQEVEAIEPTAVGKSTNFIPDIYALAGKIAADQQLLQITMDKAHGLKTGDRVRVFDSKQQMDLTVESVENDHQFSVENWSNAAPERLFVFGKEVHDFRQVEYDHIFSMNVAATQELARRLEILENENAALRSKVERQSALESQVAELARRLNLIENSGATGMRK